METRIAKALSLILHPFFLPVIVLLYLMNMNEVFISLFTARIQLVMLATVMLTTIICPAFVFYLFYRRKVIRSMFLEQREERVYPLLTMAVFYYMTYYLMKGITASIFFNFYMLGATLIAVGALVTSLYYKISLHMLAWGGCLGMLLGLVLNFSLHLFWPVVIVITLAGLTGSARLILKTHKPSEIYSGFFTGLVIMFVIFILI